MNREYGQIPGKIRDFCLVFITVQTRSGDKPVSCLIGAGAYTHPENSREGICLQAVPRLRVHTQILKYYFIFNPLNSELNPICYLLALLAHHFLHVSRIRVKSLTIRLLMSYIYGAPILDVSRSHTTTQHSR